MKALTVRPGVAGSAELREVPEPSADAGTVLVQGLAVGVCGTDREIVAGHYGWAPPDSDYLILGHESLGRVIDAPAESGLAPGDLVVGIVRCPDPLPCRSCAAGEWDMCRNGQYTEHGIKQLHGFCAERWRVTPDHAVKLDPRLGRAGVLMEPASILAKAWEHVERIGRRALWEPRRVLVTGAGPIGLLAAMMGVQRGVEVHVIDVVTDGPKPALVRDLGAGYHVGDLKEISADADVIIECTGVGSLVLDAMTHNAPGAIVCLTGLSSGKRTIQINAAELNRQMVLENDVVFGSIETVARLGDHSHEHTIRIGIVAPPAEAAKMKWSLMENFQDRIVCHSLFVPAYDVEVVEVFDPAVNKWEGVKLVAERHGIAEKEIIAIGDDVNDLPMIANAGLGVAMGNARPEVLAIAKRVIGTNADEGLAQFLEELVETHAVKPL